MSILRDIASGGNYALTGLSIANAITACFVLLVGTATFLRGRRSSTAALFFVICIASGAWLLSFAAMYAAVHPAVALVWARIAQVPVGIVAASAFHFMLLYLGRERRHRGLTIFVWVAFANLGIVGATTPVFVAGVRAHEWGFYPAATPAMTFVVVAAAAAIFPSIFLFWRRARATEALAQESAGAMMLAYILGSLCFVDFLPSIGFEIYPVGYTAALSFVVVAGTALWRFHLVDLTPEYAASQMLQTMKSAVLLVDMESRVRVANRAACTMLGYAPSELTGQPIRKVFGESDAATTSRILNSSGVLEQNMEWHGATGIVHVLASSSFVRDGKGVPVGVVYVASDHTERRRAEQALRESEHRYRTLFESNPLPMWVYDFDTLRFVTVNDAAVKHYGYTREEFQTLSIMDIRPQEDVPDIMAMLPSLPQKVSPSLFRHRKKDGTVIDVDVSSFEFVSDGRRRRLVIARDITEHRRAELLLRESEARYRTLFERNLAGVYRATFSGTILDCNESCARIFGYDKPEEMLEQPMASLYFDSSDRERVLDQLREQKSLTNLEVRMRRRDGSAVWVLENMTLLQGEGGGVIEGTIVDITDRKYAQEEIEYQAYHDMLTGLPNRLLFRDRITVALAHARRSTRTVAVMFLDLDDFKNVNDSLGHTVGDRLLQEVALRLVGCIRAEDTVARMGGDEFTVLLSDVADSRGASTVARKILDSIAEPILIDGRELRATTSIGIAIFPGDGFDAETLLKNADRAMYRAKQFGRNNYQYSTPPPYDDRATVERRLSEAMQRNEMTLHYQPIVDIASGAVVGAEALIRWNDPQRGLLAPEVFIPLAEESDLIVEIGDWVLRTACAQMKQWHDAGHGQLRLAVNLSPKQFQQRDLAARIAQILQETGFPAVALELEITESTVMQNAEVSLSTMMMLKSMGVRISIDDFGTGYSSLSYLKRFPIDTLKIDQEFVRDLSGDTNDQAIITAVVSMARALKLRVIAEGVETEAQLGFLQREECAEMQGFLYSRPVAASDFEERLRRNVASKPLPGPGISAG